MEKKGIQKSPEYFALMPTKRTVFLRTFLPWQILRFIAINLKMMSLIRDSHRGHRT